MPFSTIVRRIFDDSSKPITTMASGSAAAISSTSLSNDVGASGRRRLATTTSTARASTIGVDLVGEAVAVRVVEVDDGDRLVAVVDDELAEDVALVDVGRGGAEVQALVGVVRQLRRRVGRRELRDAGAP